MAREKDLSVGNLRVLNFVSLAMEINHTFRTSEEIDGPD